MDMRGHGDSDWAGEGNYTTEHYAADVGALIQQLDLRHVILLGGSTGGRVALVTGVLHPDRLAALIMEDVGAVRPASISQGFADCVAGGTPEFDTVEEWAQDPKAGQGWFGPLAELGNLPAIRRCWWLRYLDFGNLSAWDGGQSWAP